MNLMTAVAAITRAWAPVVALVFTTIPGYPTTADELPLSSAAMAKLSDEVQLYIDNGYVAGSFSYDTDGPYLDYSSKSFRTAGRVKLDESGLPMVEYGGVYQYNPVTLAQFALSSHAKGETENLIVAADKLLTLQREDGAFPYDFQFRHYTNIANYAPGWSSGMAQGQVLSVLSRVYTETQDQKYLAAGNAALDFLQVQHPNGPMTDLSDLDPSLSGYIFFQEYLTDPHVYTLNGYAFTLLGLYDWWQATNSSVAKDLFQRGAETLKMILPRYDLGVFSAYDLSYITHTRPPYLVPAEPHIAARYHKVHIELLSALHSITGEPIFADYEARWRDDVRQ